MSAAATFRLTSRLALGCTVLGCYISLRPIHCDSVSSQFNKPPQLKNWIWGKSPSLPKWPSRLNEVVLRDVSLQDQYGVCVDCKGDVYLWDTEDTLHMVLAGQDIQKVQTSQSKIFALSKSGKLFSFPVSTPHGHDEATSKSIWPWSQYPLPSYITQLDTDSQFSWSEKITSISAGKHHLLCLSNYGRSFAHPLDEYANNYGQLALSQIQTSSKPHTTINVPTRLADEIPNYNSKWRQSPSKRAELDTETHNALMFSSRVYEIPALRGIIVDKLIAGAQSSFALTKSHKVLGWGANDRGQIGLGDSMTLKAITTPTEVVPAKFLTNKSKTRPNCVDVNAAGDLTAFTMEYTNDNGPLSLSYDLVMCGNGQWGGLGNNSLTTFQASPVKVKNISGLQEYNESRKGLSPIRPKTVLPSTTGHVVSVLDTNDLFVWGKNHTGELGPGHKSIVNVPIPAEMVDDERVILGTARIPQIHDMQGNVSRRNTLVSQKVVLGPNQTIVYWSLP